MKLTRIISLALCLVILAGCTSDTVNEETTEITTQSQQTSQKQTPTKGGTLTLTMLNPTTLNPLENEDITVDNVLKLIYEPLFNIDNNMQIQPNIAESYSIDGKTLTIKVKDNLYWQDGKAIGADDVVYSLDTIKDAGGSAVYKANMVNISSYEQTGDKTLNVYYKSPVGAAIYNMTFPIIPKHYFRGNKDADMNPMGSGYYAFDSYKLANKLTLKAAKGINGEPYISQINVLVVSDEDTAEKTVENNLSDAYVISAENLGEIKGDITSSAILCTSNKFEFAGFNTRNRLFATGDLRQAMVQLMNIDDIAKGIYINNITKSITPINPDSSYTDLMGVDRYDPDKSTANTLILASGLTKSDFSFKILVNSENSLRVKSAEILTRSFNDFGFNTSVDAVSFEEYTQRLQSGDFDMYLGAVELTPNMNVRALVGSNGSINFTGYSNSQMDKYIDDVDNSMDLESYKKSMNELNKYLSYELPVVGIGFHKKALVHSDRVKGDITPIFNNYYYNINKWFIAK